MRKGFLFVLVLSISLLFFAYPVFASDFFPDGQSTTYHASQVQVNDFVNNRLASSEVYIYEVISQSGSSTMAEYFSSQHALTFQVGKDSGGILRILVNGTVGDTMSILQYTGFASYSQPDDFPTFYAGDWGNASDLSINQVSGGKNAVSGAETFDYQAYLVVTRRNSSWPGLSNPIIYNTRFTVYKKINVDADNNDLTPIVGKLYFDYTEPLVTFWGNNSPLDVVKDNDPSFPSWAVTEPDYYKGDYGPGDMYGQLWTSPVKFRFEPADTRYPMLRGEFDPTKLNSSQTLISQTYNDTPGQTDYGTDSVPAVPTTSATVQPQLSDLPQGIGGHVAQINDALQTHAPFAWWSQVQSSVSGSSDTSSFGIYWPVDDKGTQMGFTITSADNVRNLSTLFISAVAIFVGYMEIRRWLG